MDDKNQNQIDAVSNDFPWYIHKQSKKLMLCGKKKLIEQLRSKGEVKIFQSLCEQYSGKNFIGAPTVFSEIYKHLSDDAINILLPIINANDFLDRERSELQKKQHSWKIQQRKQAIIEHVENCTPKKIILVSKTSLLDEEIHNGIWQYIQKHGKENCAFATTEEEVAIIAEKKMEGNLTLVIIAHWEPHWATFALWTNGTKNIGASIGALLNQRPEINALKLISCNAGEVEQSMETAIPDAIKNPHCLIRRTVTFIHEYNKKIPFKQESLASHIWENTIKKNREFSLSASPGYMSFFKGHFVGSEHCVINNNPHFSNPEKLSSSKTICLTTPKGIKSPH